MDKEILQVIKKDIDDICKESIKNYYEIIEEELKKIINDYCLSPKDITIYKCSDNIYKISVIVSEFQIKVINYDNN